MRTVSFLSILNSVGLRSGMDPTDSGTWTAAIQARITEFIQSWTEKCWEHDFWPELTVLEQRAYRNAWLSTQAYVASAAGAPVEVWFAPAQSYAQALQASTNVAPFVQVNGQWVPNQPHWELSSGSYSAVPWASGANYTSGTPGVPGTVVTSPIDDNSYECITTHTSGGAFDPSKFTILTTFERYVSLDQAGQTPIGEVQQVSRSNPRTSPRFPGVLDFRVNNHGILPAPLAGVQVWMLFRLRPPVFSSTPYAGGTSFDAGDVVLDPESGNCFLSLVNANEGNEPATSPAEWQVQNIPFVFAEAIKLGALAEFLRSDGQNEKADDEEERADGKLSEAHDEVFASQGQFERANAQVYC